MNRRLSRFANRGGRFLMGAALITLVAAAVSLRNDAKHQIALAAEADRLNQMTDLANGALSDLKDAETGQRGYLITGKDSYLEPYTVGERNFDRELAELKKLTPPNGADARLLSEIARTGELKKNEMANVIGIYQRSGQRAAFARVAADVGKQYMDEIREAAGDMVRYESAAANLNRQEQQRLGDFTRNKLLVVAGVLFLLTLAGTLLLDSEIQHERHLSETLEASQNKYKELADNLDMQVEERTRELQQLNKELTAFSYSVSHDLRAPLRSIDGFSQIVLEDYADKLDDNGRRLLERMRAAARRMGQLIQSLLDLSRVTRAELTRQDLSLSEIAVSTLDALRASAADRQVEVVVEPDLWVNADPTLARALLENLLQNAWKFTSKTTTARIEVGRGEDEGKHFFFVRDNGAGFDPAYANRLFTPFQRLHSESDFEGTGIGLATVQRVVNRHGGRIWAEGAPGKGATFYFALS